MTKKTIEALVEKVGEKLIAIASTENKDRVGDIVKADGWDLKNFKKNPVLLFAHKYNEAPIGLAKNIKIEKNQLVFEPIFHDITQLAREVKAMFLADPPIMRAFSVGFLPKKFNDEDYHIIEEQELLEISAVPVPANAEALSLTAKSINEEEEKEIGQWVEKEIKEVNQDNVKEIINDTKKKLEKSPACRQEGESKDECVSRKIPEIMHENPDMKQVQAVAIAESLCSHACKIQEEIEEKKEEKKEEVKIEEKAGRVLSESNRGKVKNAIDLLKETISTLKDLLLMSEPSTNGENKSQKGRIEEVHKVRKNRTIVRALQKISKEINFTLRNVKKEK